MTEQPRTRVKGADPDARPDRKYAVSANRGQGRHRVRYVETGGAAVDPDDCVFCQSMPDLRDDDRAAKPEPQSQTKAASD